MANNTIVLTGGGSTGHVAVNLALIPLLKKDGWKIHYIGSKKGIEKELILNIDGVMYHEISTGKLRRYFSLDNFLDIFKIIIGIIQSIWKIFKIKPSVVFSKGGFVSVPVVVGAWLNRIPIISHESDLTPGLANKIAQLFVNTIYTTFPETTEYIKSGKGEYLGPVIRDSLKGGNGEKAKKYLGIDNEKPAILIMGGSLGADFLNQIIRNNLTELTKDFNIIHLCGKNLVDHNFDMQGYHQFEYINEELKDIIAYSDFAITRAGSNSIFEFLYYKIPMILIPLPAYKSRGDQVENALSFEKQGFASMIEEDKLTDTFFLESINEFYSKIDFYKNSMENIEFNNNIQKIYNKIKLIKKKI